MWKRVWSKACLQVWELGWLLFGLVRLSSFCSVFVFQNPLTVPQSVPEVKN